MASKSVLSHGYQLPWDQFKFFMYKAKAELNPDLITRM